MIYSPNVFAPRIQALGNFDITREILISNNNIRKTSGGYLLYIFHRSLEQQEDMHMAEPEDVHTND